MKKNSSSNTARITLSTLFFLTGAILLCLVPLTGTHAQNPAGGTIHPTDTSPVTWVGTTVSPGGNLSESSCVDSGGPPMQSCEIFTLNVTGTPADWAGNKIRVLLTWQQPTNEYDIYIHKGSLSGRLVDSGTQGPGLTSQVAFINPATDGTGVFMVHVAYDTTATSAADEYHGAAIGISTAPPTIPPALQDTGPKIGFENFSAPGVLVPVTTTEAGQQVNSVEYIGRNAGEPSIGNNWNTGVTAYFSGLETLFVTFNDTCPATGQSSLWASRQAPSSVAIDSDPIGFTDHQTGRTFAGSLTLLSPDTCKTSFTDSDGLPTMTAPTGWTLTQGSGIGSGVDHETIGGGPYNANSTPPPPPHPAYPNAVYYCSQEGSPASGPPSFCSRSDNGGLTFGPSVPLTTPPVNVCGGLHGHVKVSPVDGTVYVPFNTCGGFGSLLVSIDNGLNWTIRHVVDTVANIQATPSPSFQDPAVGIDANGRVYYIIANSDSAAAVFTSDDHGATWTLRGDVGATYALQNIRYPAAVAGDAGRASVSFYGTTTSGDALQSSFNGVWHLYVANTFDGGLHWTTTDATPNAPMQRGCIWAKGGANICRNLLDFFDMTVDQQGRVEVGYENGCEGGNCAQAIAQPDHFGGNAFTNTATIARQSSGRRLFAINDPPTTTSKPGMPSVTQRRIGHLVHLGWSEADTGNSPITGYQISRGTASGAETLLTTVPGTQTGGTYDDFAAIDTTKTYYYKVQAMNAVGTSCGNNEVAAPYVGDACIGITIHQNDPTHPEANAGTNTPASLLIDYIAVGEPSGSSDFLFKMKVNSLATIPPNSRWRIMWDSFSSPGQQYYVGMTTGNTGAPTFEYGTLADANVPAVFVIAETTVASCAVSGTSCTLLSAGAASQYNTDGTITIIVPKSAFGNPPVGDLLGAIGGRTLTGDTSNCATDLPPCTPESKLERSNAFVDHTFVKAQTDDAYPAATYTVVGNGFCALESVVSRMTHGSITPPFDINLPRIGPRGVECRRSALLGTGNYTLVFSFLNNLSSVLGATVTGHDPATGTGTVSGNAIGPNPNQYTVNLTNVSNAQYITVTLNSVVDAAGNSGNVLSPQMGVLIGDVTANGVVTNTDVGQVKAQVNPTTPVTQANFREDVTVNGFVTNTDVGLVKGQVNPTGGLPSPP